MAKQTIAQRKALKSAKLDDFESAMTDEKPIDRKDGWFIGLMAGLLAIIWVLIIYGWWKAWQS